MSWSLFPAVLVDAVEDESEFASARAAPGPAERSPLASLGTSGHPTSGSNRNTKKQRSIHIQKTLERAFPLNMFFLPEEVSLAHFMDSSTDWGIICTSSVMFRNDSSSQGSCAPSVISH